MTERKAKVISVLNQKGGVGKTTIATNLAHGLILEEYKTLLVDGDPQGSARDWHEANEGEIVPCLGMDRETLPQDLKSVLHSYDVIIIDGAPKIEKLASAAIRVSDVILIPVQPSQYDIWATGDLVELIKHRQDISDGKPEAAFIISRMIKKTALSNEIESSLVEYGFPVFSSKTSQMMAYMNSVDKGQSVFIHKRYMQASIEFAWVVSEVISRYLDIKI